MKFLFSLLCVIAALAIDPSKFQSIAQAVRRRVENGDSAAHSTHLVQDSPQKHDPFIVFTGDKASIQVRGPDGSTVKLHPQTEEHFIVFLWAENQKGEVVHLAQLSGSDSQPTAEFDWTGLTGTLTPYSLCNLHGLWQGPTYTLERERVVAKIQEQLDASASGPKSFHATTGKLVKHSPFVNAVKGKEATVSVAGSDAEPTTTFHPQTPEHYITTLFLKDQHGTVAGLRQLKSSDGAKPHTVTVESKATELLPFEFCNLHGLWEGPRYVIASEGREL